MSKNKRAATEPRRPVHKIGPFHNGIGIAIWMNRVETEHGPRCFRSITVNARRYRDAKTGEWKDAASYRPVDLATLELAIAQARQYLATVPLPGQPVEGDEYEDMPLDGELQEELATA
jgi:hypothetical protein